MQHVRKYVALGNIPKLSQLLPVSPFRIPYLAEHAYIGARQALARKLKQYGAKHKAMVLVAGSTHICYIG